MKKIIFSANLLTGFIFADWGQFAQIIENAKALDDEMNLTKYLGKENSNSEIEKYKNLDKEKNISGQAINFLKNRNKEASAPKVTKSYGDYLETAKNLENDMNLSGKVSKYLGKENSNSEIEKYKNLDKDLNISNKLIEIFKHSQIK